MAEDFGGGEFGVFDGRNERKFEKSRRDRVGARIRRDKNKNTREADRRRLAPIVRRRFAVTFLPRVVGDDVAARRGSGFYRTGERDDRSRISPRGSFRFRYYSPGVISR